ncbi:hemerythrin domain-containing protein [Jiangella alkaliphila]|uniref:Hemerythrin HHE cation binding domain-containing protein n=1 Tax=Jiangella alkaliphila TaxID=419479 RepID=A0A1H2LB98_9ACTN|nr:hemerythrin domain-containing protein [Jiangella alkaliphila]SDU78317.1 Hemerythrin HHE cation binding domain-containing protein [Jiangella alkaliphila]
MTDSRDVVDLIEKDHREIERLFELLRTDPGRRDLAVTEVTALLVAHSRAEEAEVYPVARDEAGETDEVAHSQEEHAEAEAILERLAGMDADDPGYESVLRELVDSVGHHVEEEENTVLPGMRQRLSAERRAELGEAFLAARAEHLGDRPGDATRDELAQQARNLGVDGTSSMSKAELRDEVTPD